MIEEELEPFSWCEDVRTVNTSGVTFFPFYYGFGFYEVGARARVTLKLKTLL